LEYARPRGGLCSGFICSDCFAKQFGYAFLVVVPLAILFIVLLASYGPRQHSKQIQAMSPSDTREDKIRDLEWKLNWPTQTDESRQRIKREIQELKGGDNTPPEPAERPPTPKSHDGAPH
jgi:hypothetical protein